MKQFFRERRTLILLFAVPVLVLLVLGGVFGRTSTEVDRSVIGLCDLDNSEFSGIFVAGIENNTKIMDYSNNSNCSSFVEKEVLEGRLSAAIVIPAGFEKGITDGISQDLTVYLDNSRIQTSPSIEAFMKAAVQETGQEIGNRFILTIWERLDDADGQLLDLIEEVNGSRNRAIEIKQSLQETADSLNSMNLGIVEDELDAANSTIYHVLDTLESAEGNLTEIESEFAEYDEELEKSEQDLENIIEILGNASSLVKNAKSAVNCSNPVYLPYCLSLDSLNSEIISTNDSIAERLDAIRDARSDIAESNETIQDFKSSIEDAREGSEDAEQRIENMRDFVYGLVQSKQKALSTIYEINLSLDTVIEKSYELESIITDSRNQISEITSRQPESIVSPIILSSKRLFGERTFFDFLLPSLLPMILMFISLFLSSTSLVREKNMGILGRIAVSQVNSLKYAVVKVISYTIVLIPEAILLVLISSLLYGAFPIFDIATSLIVFQTLVLLLLAFTAIGVLIAIYSESEATAFLASLVVGLPLLFMSGLLFPFEFMPTYISAIGYASPLTQAVLTMQSVVLYHSPQAIGFGILIIYALVFIILSAISIRRVR